MKNMKDKLSRIADSIAIKWRKRHAGTKLVVLDSDYRVKERYTLLTRALFVSGDVVNEYLNNASSDATHYFVVPQADAGKFCDKFTVGILRKLEDPNGRHATNSTGA